MRKAKPGTPPTSSPACRLSSSSPDLLADRTKGNTGFPTHSTAWLLAALTLPATPTDSAWSCPDRGSIPRAEGTKLRTYPATISLDSKGKHVPGGTTCGSPGTAPSCPPIPPGCQTPQDAPPSHTAVPTPLSPGTCVRGSPPSLCPPQRPAKPKILWGPLGKEVADA